MQAHMQYTEEGVLFYDKEGRRLPLQGTTDQLLTLLYLILAVLETFLSPHVFIVSHSCFLIGICGYVIYCHYTTTEEDMGFITYKRMNVFRLLACGYIVHAFLCVLISFHYQWILLDILPLITAQEVVCTMSEWLKHRYHP
jgi:uncharacterized membrane protein